MTPTPKEATDLVLIIDDNSMNRYILSQYIKQYGYPVATAENGKEALQMMRDGLFSLVLLDIEMPVMNGYELLAVMKADHRLRNIPVVVISGVEDINSVALCIEQGAEDYLVKPFNQTILRARVSACIERKRLRDQEILHLLQIEHEQKRANELLHVIFPDKIVEELKTTDKVLPRRHTNVAVLFADIVGFTAHCDTHDPEEVVLNLQKLVERWEDIALANGAEKTKTIGDAFMATAGLLKPTENPVKNCVQCGLEMISAVREIAPLWAVRIGVHIGPVIAGVLGRRQYQYDLWGDTVNTASRMENHGVVGSVNLSRTAWEQISHCGRAESLGLIAIKGKGDMELFRFIGFIDS